MESKNRTVWIFVILALVLVCCCLMAVVAAALGLFTLGPIEGLGSGEVREGSAQSFNVGGAPELSIDNFAGRVTVIAGSDGIIEVQVTKRARGQGRLDRINVEITPRDDGLVIVTRNPARFSNVSVDLEITAPASTRLEVQTGAGEVQVRGLAGDVQVDTGAGSVTVADVSGGIVADTGAGSIDVRGASGPVRLSTGAGSVSYEGDPLGECRFETGTGSIELTLPASVNVAVDLSSGIGDVDVAFDVVGEVSRRSVEGVIGSGAQGMIYAHTGTGSIDVIRR